MSSPPPVRVSSPKPPLILSIIANNCIITSSTNSIFNLRSIGNSEIIGQLSNVPTFLNGIIIAYWKAYCGTRSIYEANGSCPSVKFEKSKLGIYSSTVPNCRTKGNSFIPRVRCICLVVSLCTVKKL